MIRRALPIVFWFTLACTFVLAVMPHPPQPPGNPGDKFQHIMAFAVLTMLALAAFPKAHWLRIFAWLSAYGLLIEIIQAVPVLQRTSDWHDLAADVMAVAVVLLVAGAIRWVLSRR